MSTTVRHYAQLCSNLALLIPTTLLPNNQYCPIFYLTLFSTHDCVAEFSFNTIFKFADDTAVVGLVYNSKEKVYLEEMGNLACWYQDNNLLLNVSKSWS